MVLVTVAAGLGIAAPLGAQALPEVRPGGQSIITLRGFLSATAFLQDASFGFGNGQNTAWVVADPEDNSWILSSDVRSTRVGLDLHGPPIGGGWDVGGTIEIDFFGGFAASGAFTDEQPAPRLRLAYADLVRGGTTLRIGQFWTPVFGYAPASTSHLGFPLGLGAAGLIGWRYPGIFLYQNLTDARAPTRAQLQLAAVRGSWTAATQDSITNHLSAGERSGFPQLQARLDLGGRTAGGVQWAAYAAGHYDRKDLRPYGAAGAEAPLEGTALAAGLRLVPGPLTLHGSGYTGRAVGQQMAHIVQFGDIAGWGAWGQAGYALSPSWSAWLYFGVDNPDDADLPAAGSRLRNQLATAMLRYASGPYQLGIEWLRAETDYRIDTGALADTRTRTGNQWAFSVVYSF